MRGEGVRLQHSPISDTSLMGMLSFASASFTGALGTDAVGTSVLVLGAHVIMLILFCRPCYLLLPVASPALAVSCHRRFRPW